MGKPGPKPGTHLRRIISTKWSSELAYAIGLLATDGCLFPRGHLIDLSSIDRQQLENFRKCLKAEFNIGYKDSKVKRCMRIQFKSVQFYTFLESVGLTPAKSKTMGIIKVPAKYFWDFLRGAYDGDGSSYAYWDKRWRSSYMFYTEFISASPTHIQWLRDEIYRRLGIRGHVTGTKKQSLQQLKYAKSDSLKLLRKMYYSRDIVCLSRKRLKLDKILDTVGEKL